jgi:catechol 2,3-dioxygenase-like lactoylglutathione lyase family enzyme
MTHFEREGPGYNVGFPVESTFMAFPTPRLDHVVVDARDRMDEAARVYRSLGFQLTERSRHTLGSVNHLAVFGSDYLELLGFEPEAGPVRPDIAAFPVGMNGLVFSTDQPDSLWAELRARNVPVQDPQSFSRPVSLAAGESQDAPEAKFRVVRLRGGTASFGRVYFCHHLTPELVWRPEWQKHPNGALGVARILIAAREPAASAEILSRMFGPEAVRAGPDGSWTLAAGPVPVDLDTPEQLARRLGDAKRHPSGANRHTDVVSPDPAGRADYMGALTIRTASLAQAARVLEAGGIRRARIEPHRILVPAADAMNVALEFVE